LFDIVDSDSDAAAAAATDLARSQHVLQPLSLASGVPLTGMSNESTVRVLVGPVGDVRNELYEL
jgi:hypothetical protein